MPRFYFDFVEDGSSVADRNGLLMPELEEAELEAAGAIAQMMADRQAKTQHMVDVGYGILAHHQKLESDGKISKADAQAAAMNAIRGLRYDKVEYFWINDMSPKMVMHPIKPELDGKDLGEMKDPAGNRLFMGFVDVVKSKGSGFYSYLWPKPGFDQPVSKISYVKGFAPWGWIIGTGIYLDDVDAIFRQTAMMFAMVSLIVFAVVLIAWARSSGR